MTILYSKVIAPDEIEFYENLLLLLNKLNILKGEWSVDGGGGRYGPIGDAIIGTFSITEHKLDYKFK
jgi:hypothetical protein